MARIMSSIFLLLAAVLSVVAAWDIGNEGDRHGCQAWSRNPLAGCDQRRTLFVNGADSKAQFKTVQSGKKSPSLS